MYHPKNNPGDNSNIAMLTRSYLQALVKTNFAIEANDVFGIIEYSTTSPDLQQPTLNGIITTI